MHSRHVAAQNGDARMPLAQMLLVLILACSACNAQLQTRYGLTDLYFESTYLPPVTPYPWAPAWSPDGTHLAFVMEGAIWLIPTGGGVAEQLTGDQSATDSEPTWSPDGKELFFVRDTGTTTEIWLIDVLTRREKQLTNHKMVSLSPRANPAGKTLVYISNTQSTDFTFRLRELNLETRISREIYHARNASVFAPDWNTAGDEILFQSSQPVGGSRAYGAGYVYRLHPDSGTEPELMLKEELFHTARPRYAPHSRDICYVAFRDGKSAIWSANMVTGNKVEMVRTEDELFTPAWSPTGDCLVSAACRGGAGRLIITDLRGGEGHEVRVEGKRRLRPWGRLELIVREAGKAAPSAARVNVLGCDGKSYSPAGSAHRQSQATGDHYSYCFGESVVDVPAGTTTVTVVRGFDHVPISKTIEVKADEVVRVEFELQPLLNLHSRGWRSGDTHCHIHYGGTVSVDVGDVLAQAGAEDLDFANVLVANRDNVIPDRHLFRSATRPAQTTAPAIIWGQELRPMFGGHVGLLGGERWITPPYTGYVGTPCEADYPSNSDLLKIAGEHKSIGGYVHPFYINGNDPEMNDYQGARELPADVAHRYVTFYELVCTWSYEAPSAEVWYRLLNLGFRIAAAGGTDSFADFYRSPAIGGARTYVKCDDLNSQAWLKGLAEGRSFATNGPLLLLAVDNRLPGDTVTVKVPGDTVTVDIEMKSIATVTRVELLYNGKVVWSAAPREGGMELKERVVCALDKDGWLAARAVGPDRQHYLMDVSTFAHTSPIYVMAGRVDPASKSDAEYFVRWCDRAMELLRREGRFATTSQRNEVMRTWTEAREVFQRLSSDRELTREPARSRPSETGDIPK